MNTGKRIIDLSLIPDGIEPRLYVSQYDVGVTLTFNWSGTLAAGGAARVMGTKPSGIGFDLACTKVGSGTSVTGFTVETTLDMTSEAGEFPAEIRITEGTQVVGSQNFTLVVERSPHPDGTIDGYEEGRTIIETVTGLVNDAEESASEAATSATAAASSATAAAQSATSAAADAESADASAARAMATTPEGYEEFVTELLANQNGGYVRKNLLKNTAASTGNFTVNADGTVTVNGSFTSQTNLNIGTIRFDEDTRVTLNGAPAGGGTSSYALFISGKGTDSGSGATFTLNAGVTYTVVLRLYAGYTANNLVIKPMIRPATIEDGTYVPYAPSNSALNADLANTSVTEIKTGAVVRKNNKTVWLSLVNLAVTASTILNAPAGFRPLDRVSFLGNWKNTSNQYEAVLITVWSSGDVVAFSPTLNANISNGTLTASGVWLTS